MTAAERKAFSHLFKALCTRSLGGVPEQPLSEPECRHLSHEIEEKTGLVIGWKSLKNYSAFVLDLHTAKPENPSTATLDTLARYLANAPVTTEALRKRNEAHFGYWFRYLEQFAAENASSPAAAHTSRLRGIWITATCVAVLLTAIGAWVFGSRKADVSESFQQLSDEYLHKSGWLLLARDSTCWASRNIHPGNLTLFTLPGDNWSHKSHTPEIRNLLARRIGSTCFSAEIHLSDFVPEENWQQAGLILLEDTAYLGKSLRLSLAFNNFFGGYRQPAEILVQSVAGFGKNSPNVEEVVHQRLFLPGEADSALVSENLRFSALRIEKRGQTFRFLYAASPFEDFSYKEIGTYSFDMKARYVGIFALRGFVDTAAAIPVKMRFFRLEEIACLP